jgi:pimeloyl-ACP methyl ester carboxylesterase
VLLKMLGAPRANAGHSDIVEHYVGLFTTLGRHRDPTEIDALRQRFDAAIRRAYRPEGTRRQLLAVCASPDRRGLLGRLTTPSLVIHGDCDPLVPLPAGRILANAIPNASLSIIPGMGHDLPSWALGEIASQILAHLS